ncbi:DNA methyltransferase [Rhizobium cremeum]|uniref:DNA methyltransferase n=1 Tax=Rhizobium cremeum TaxID=2813827 RepID=UPI0039E09E6C
MMDYQSFLGGRVILHSGDCLEVLSGLPENSIDSAVMDPPYHLTSIVERFGKEGSAAAKSGATGAFGRASAGFMGKEWDGGDIAFRVKTWEAVLRVLKPGGYLLAFASTRGYGRMSVAIEEAGFIGHPLIAFLMEHDDAADFLATLTKPQLDALTRLMVHKELGGMLGWIFGSGFPKATRIKAEWFDGWRYGGQALKPAIEPIYMGQKPFSEKTGTANVLLHGTGAVNIDGCRIGDEIRTAAYTSLAPCEGNRLGHADTAAARRGTQREAKEYVGRWPANLIHDGSAEVIEAFPEASGQQREVNDTFAPKQGTAVYGDYGPRPTVAPRDDGGSAARFFYSAKADADDRIGSKHPTVKPVDLMRYLVRLVTPPGGTVLDAFAGTGTTGEAAWREGCSAILIEREAEYQKDIAERMRLCLAGPGERSREIVKRRGLVQPAGPLFGGEAAE